MKILIKIGSDTFLLCHEALSMAFALAAFDHQIQLQIGSAMLNLIIDEPNCKIANMLASLDMYDMPPAWLDEQDMQHLKKWQDEHAEQNYKWCSQLALKPTNDSKFDTTFNL